jgi:hypothetical protein
MQFMSAIGIQSQSAVSRKAPELLMTLALDRPIIQQLGN